MSGNISNVSQKTASFLNQPEPPKEEKKKIFSTITPSTPTPVKDIKEKVVEDKKDLKNDKNDDDRILFDLAFISLFVDLTMYKPSTVANAIKYMLNGTDVDVSVNIDEISQICNKIITKIKERTTSSLSNVAKRAKSVLTHLKRECPEKLQELSTASVTLTLEFKPQLKPFKGYTKLGIIGSGVGGDVFKVLKDEKPYVVKKGNVEELAILQLLSHSPIRSFQD